MYALLLDDNYKTVAFHIDENTIHKIVEGQYVDFGRLISKDKYFDEDDEKLYMIVKEGQLIGIPASEKEKSSINTLEKWEAAFRVYSKIYLEYHPGRATELVEYNHMIHSIAGDFAWSNVYRYDREFRLHMEENPERNWGVILQKAWSMFLRVRIAGPGQQPKSGPSESTVNGQKRSKICYRYNAGKCTYGYNCKFEHKCSLCYKTGHGSHICRRAQFRDRERDRESGEYNNRYQNNYRKDDRNDRRRERR